MFDEIVEAAPIIPKLASNYTVVSLLPFPLRENKPQLIPGYFQIPGSSQDSFSVLQVGESIHWMENPFPGMPPVKMTTSPRDIARSIVEDFISGQLGLRENAGPGIFYVDGHHDYDSIKKNHVTRLHVARTLQNNWFVELIRIADDDWAQHHQHKFISDIQRYAVKALGMTREWTTVSVSNIMKECPACKTLVRDDAIVCLNCKAVLKPEEYKKLTFAQQD